MILTFGNELEALGSSILGIKVLQWWCRVKEQACITKCLAVGVIPHYLKQNKKKIKINVAAELDHLLSIKAFFIDMICCILATCFVAIYQGTNVARTIIA